ncbi:hypothetical protein A1Q2_02312 [Trichosporon asahii var. asahii CBS 8904]|uniref:Uncharacterized protein n=1 Tax=Trichosporon asahii var. asahii (strain CBS 8904) TaxID=1220162 RepID=K1W3C6_TRIAC|nr:hypothetical protein A1Q2_02312 [Trichosporon asahii var. asahii CBS 8904]
MGAGCSAQYRPAGNLVLSLAGPVDLVDLAGLRAFGPDALPRAKVAFSGDKRLSSGATKSTPNSYRTAIQKKSSLPSLSTTARIANSPTPLGFIPSASSSTTSLHSHSSHQNTIKPVSILRKPSLPTLPSESLLSPAPKSAPIGHSTHVPWTPTPISHSHNNNKTSGDNGSMALTASSFAFPPLPPLPPFPLDSSSNYESSNRRSAPAATTTFVAASGGQRLRTRRSRVSFREQVDVSGDGEASRPRSTVSVASSASAPVRRGSRGDDVAARKATTPTSAYSKLSSASVSSTAPRPKLKRVASSTAVLPPSSRALSTDDFDAFRPQTLRYPKMPSALARLSDTSVPPPAPNTWSTSRKVTAPARTSVPLPLSTTKEHHVAPSGHFVSEFGQVDVPSRRERTVSQISQTSSRKGSGKTRSPIPSWSSTCPSLINAHRASIASTLTAPSMTSLLLSPQSPHEVYLPSKDEQQAFEDHLATPWGVDSGMHDSDVPEMDALKEKRVREADLSATDSSVTEPVKPRVPSRRHRQSEPSHQPPSSFNAPPPPHPTSAPRVAERLLRLQNSLADLRMQRGMTRSPEPEEDERPWIAEGTRCPTTDELGPVRRRERPGPYASPLERRSAITRHPVLVSPARDQDANPRPEPGRPRRRALDEPGLVRLRVGGGGVLTHGRAHREPQVARAAAQAPETALVTCRPDDDAALSDRPPRLRARPSLGAIHTTPARIPSPPSPTFGDLVRSAPRSAPGSLKGRAARRPTFGLSDDESDLDLTLPPLNAALRSHVIPSSSRLLVTKTRTRGLSQGGLDEAPSNSLGWSGSESEEEEFSRTVARIASRKSLAPQRKLQKRPSLPVARMTTNAYARHSLGTNDKASPVTPTPLGDRPASAIGTMRPNGTAALLALVEQKYASSQALPRPKKYVQGWGAPEVLHDDEWPEHPLEEVAEVGEAW